MSSYTAGNVNIDVLNEKKILIGQKGYQCNVDKYKNIKNERIDSDSSNVQTISCQKYVIKDNNGNFNMEFFDTPGFVGVGNLEQDRESIINILNTIEGQNINTIAIFFNMTNTRITPYIKSYINLIKSMLTSDFSKNIIMVLTYSEDFDVYDESVINEFMNNSIKNKLNINTDNSILLQNKFSLYDLNKFNEIKESKKKKRAIEYANDFKENNTGQYEKFFKIARSMFPVNASVLKSFNETKNAYSIAINNTIQNINMIAKTRFEIINLKLELDQLNSLRENLGIMDNSIIDLESEMINTIDQEKKNFIEEDDGPDKNIKSNQVGDRLTISKEELKTEIQLSVNNSLSTNMNKLEEIKEKINIIEKKVKHYTMREIALTSDVQALLKVLMGFKTFLDHKSLAKTSRDIFLADMKESLDETLNTSLVESMNEIYKVTFDEIRSIYESGNNEK